MPKATKAEAQQRINHIFKMTLNGASRPEILQYAAENWKIEERTVDSYIAAVRKEFEAVTAADKPYEHGKAAERLDNLYKNAIRIQDFKTALAIQRERNLLFGLHAPQKMQTLDWRSQAIEDIKAGRLQHAALANAFDRSLADELFALAGKLVTVSDDTELPD